CGLVPIDVDDDVRDDVAADSRAFALGCGGFGGLLTRRIDELPDGLATLDLAPAEIEDTILGEGVGVGLRVVPVEGEQIACLQVLDLRAVVAVAAAGGPAACGQCQCDGGRRDGQSGMDHRKFPLSVMASPPLPRPRVDVIPRWQRCAGCYRPAAALRARSARRGASSRVTHPPTSGRGACQADRPT